MVKRIIAVAFIYFCTVVAWVILAGTIDGRTEDMQSRIQGKVASSWGTPQDQHPPVATYTHEEPVTRTVVTEGKSVQTKQIEEVEYPLSLDSSQVDAVLDLDPRKKGLLWYSTYKVAFRADYAFHNPSDHEEQVVFGLKLPSKLAVYDDLQFLIDGKVVETHSGGDAASAAATVGAGKPVTLGVRYFSHGLQSWRYHFGDDVTQVRDFSLNLHTNFADIDFPENALSPTDKQASGKGWDLKWNYKNLVSGYQIALAMPEKTQPGPLAGEISRFAPVSLLFFFFLIFIISSIRKIDLHPMNYFFLATAFFAFHLLLAYLADQIDIHLAFAICSAVSVFLVVSYLRLAVGLRFAAVEAAGGQLVYLVLFSYAFFFKGFTGLTITIGAILSLFVVMQLTGRIKWGEFDAADPRAVRT